MSKMLLNLRHVPDDEARDVRELLENNAIACFETEPNRWGVSAGAIWVREDEQFECARALMDDYQAQRRAAARQAWAAARRDGTAWTFRAQLRHSPLRVLLILLGIVLCAALSLWPLLLAAW
jgi:hypothetical protein